MQDLRCHSEVMTTSRSTRSEMTTTRKTSNFTDARFAVT
jgi:hypothetical protein